ncbi:hypothetical protein EVU52_26580 [Salmonella enterica subsp. enterica serovar Takoradi]|nr:hypothetical protein [Salmonella enterica subsp. enterica serovar Takoradi]
MNSRKTTTLSFRIDDELKNELTKLAERENKTITNKAKEVLIETLKLKPAKTMTDEVRENIVWIDEELKKKIKAWDMDIQSQLNTFKLNRDLLNEFRNSASKLRENLTLEKRKSRNQILIFSIIMLFFNASFSVILFYLLR